MTNLTNPKQAAEFAVQAAQTTAHGCRVTEMTVLARMFYAPVCNADQWRRAADHHWYC